MSRCIERPLQECGCLELHCPSGRQLSPELGLPENPTLGNRRAEWLSRPFLTYATAVQASERRCDQHGSLSQRIFYLLYSPLVSTSRGSQTGVYRPHSPLRHDRDAYTWHGGRSYQARFWGRITESVSCASLRVSTLTQLHMGEVMGHRRRLCRKRLEDGTGWQAELKDHFRSDRRDAPISQIQIRSEELKSYRLLESWDRMD